jgi:hypothetical protein
MNKLDVGLQVYLNQLEDLSSHSTDSTNLKRKVNKFLELMRNNMISNQIK